MRNIVFEALAEAARNKEPVTLGIISAAKGSSPQKIGAKALFYADGRIQGTLGGGCLEAEIQQRAIQSLRAGEPAAFELLLDHDFGWDDGLICGGKVEGLILPNAQDAGERFWAQLGERRTSLAWGVGKDFSLGLIGTRPRHHLPGEPARNSSTAKPSPHPALSGLPELATSRRPSRHWLPNSISPSLSLTTVRRLPTTAISRRRF